MARTETADGGDEVTYGTETHRLADALMELHSVSSEFRPAESELVATFRNMVVEAVTDLVAVAAGGAPRRRALSSVDDLQVAPTAFLSRALRAYPRLAIAESLSPADAFAAHDLSPTTALWQRAARHALTSAHIACSQPTLPTVPGERTTVIADLAAIAQVAAAMDGALQGAFRALGDPRAADLEAATRVAMPVICREVRRQHDVVQGDRAWDSVPLPGAPRPLVVGRPGDFRRATVRLRRLLDVTSGQLDVRGIAAIVQAQARDHFRMHELLAAHAQCVGVSTPREVVSHSVAHLEMAHLLADSYRTTARVGSPFKGDRRAVTQAAELHRGISSVPLSAPPSAEVLLSLAEPQLHVVGALARSVSAGLAEGRLLVPGWDDESGGTAWTLAERAANPAPLRRQLEAIGHRSWAAFALPPAGPRLEPVGAVRHRLAHLTQ
ncbi:hypothetical protein GCM10027446_01370 [Angustibacter peucedani]